MLIGRVASANNAALVRERRLVLVLSPVISFGFGISRGWSRSRENTLFLSRLMNYEREHSASLAYNLYFRVNLVQL